MSQADELKKIVKEKYSRIAVESEIKKSSCCCCGDSDEPVDYSKFNLEYDNMDGYVKDADLKLGCGIPTDAAGINKGETVVDLGSGAGNDVFVARALTGNEGKVIGIDFSEEMLFKAEKNKAQIGYDNVEFRLGEIEAVPVEDNTADVVISNCVLNLVPDKNKAYSEVFRILKPGGHFCVSDIVLRGELPEELKKSAAAYAGCVSGALRQEDYLGAIAANGFENVEIKLESEVKLPDALLKEYLNPEDLPKFVNDNLGIYSITVVGYKK